jgi:hypothetical protein
LGQIILSVDFFKIELESMGLVFFVNVVNFEDENGAFYGIAFHKTIHNS